MDMMCNYLSGDPRLVEQIVKELKSQGIFDQFRKECISDVDTKPAYQNLRQRVEGSVSNFLHEQTWNPDMNKNQVREMLRKHINESGFLETGVERIVDQVVNPKINSVFIPKVDDVMYTFLGIDRPKKNKSTPLEINTTFDLLPKDLEAISPEIPGEKELPKDDIEEAKIIELPLGSDTNGDKIIQEENSVDSQSSVLSGNASRDSNNSVKQDSLMSLNSSESRMSLSVATSKIELEDACLSQKSSDSNNKTNVLDEKTNTENVIETKEELGNPPENSSEKSCEELKSRMKEKKRDKHHSSSDRSKSRNDKEKSKSEKSENKDGKNIEEKKYKIPKLSDKNKEHKLKEKEDKHKSDRGRSEKDKKYDKDKKSKHSSEKSSSSGEKSKRDKTEKRDKDDKKDRKESSKSDRGREDRKSSSSRKRDRNTSKDDHRGKDKDSHSKISLEDTTEKNKNEHGSSGSKKDSKSKKDDEKSKTPHKKDEKNDKEDRKRKRRSKDDHHSSKEKRNGGRSSDRDSDGPSSSKKPYVSPQNVNGECSNQQTSQDSAALNSESNSGYSGNSDKVEEIDEEQSHKNILEMQKMKIPKFASNLNEAMKIMKIRKLLKKLDGMIKTNPSNPQVQLIMTDIEQLTKDVKKDQLDKSLEKNEESDENQTVETTKSTPINIDEFISSSNISMAKWNALEAQFMEQITDVDYNSYESPYLDEEELSFEKQSTVEHNENDSSVYGSAELEDTLISKVDNLQNQIQPVQSQQSEQKSPNESKTGGEFDEQDSSSTEMHEINNYNDMTSISQSPRVEKAEICCTDGPDIDNKRNHKNGRNFKENAIVLLRKHPLAEEMIKKNEYKSLCEIDNAEGTCSVEEIGKENIEINTRQDKPDKLSLKNENTKEKAFSRELDENNLIIEEPNSQNIEIYNMQNSCEVCLDSKRDLCKGFDQLHNHRSLDFIRCIINMLENEISKFKDKNIEYLSVKHSNFELTQKRKVTEKKTDATNNTSDITTSKFVNESFNKQLNKMEVANQSSEMEKKRYSDMTANENIDVNPSKSVEKTGEKKNRANQRYSSEDLYKPRNFLRRSARDSKNP